MNRWYRVVLVLCAVVVVVNGCGLAGIGRRSLDWPSAGDASVPTGLSSQQTVPLTDGAYQQRVNGVVADFRLTDLHDTGDLDGDSDDDAVGILTVDVTADAPSPSPSPSGSAKSEEPAHTTTTSLVAFINENGTAKPAGGALTLGPGVTVKSLDIKDSKIKVEYTNTAGPHTLHARLDGDALVATTARDQSSPPPGPPQQGPVTTISVPPSGRTELTGILGFGVSQYYDLSGVTGQQLQITVESPDNVASLAILSGRNEILLAPDKKANSFTGTFRTKDTYRLRVATDSGAPAQYRMKISLSAPPSTNPGQDTKPDVPAAGNRKVIYLTFDDGPDPRYTPEILQLLAKYNAKATFFMIGVNAASHPDLVRKVYEAGHTVANHSYSHADLTTLSPQKLEQEIGGTQRTLGKYASDCMRPPYGAINPSVRQWLAGQGIRPILWDIDPVDWKKPGVGAIVGNIMANAHPGAVVLVHDGGGERSQTVDAIRIALHKLHKQGYTFESICARS